VAAQGRDRLVDRGSGPRPYTPSVDFLVPVVGIGFGVLVMWLRGSGLPRLALWRLGRGADVSVRGRLRLPERSEAAILRRRGDDLVVTTRRRDWLVRAKDVRVARGQTSITEEDERWTVRLRGANGVVARLDVPGPWRKVVQALVGAEAPASRRRGATTFWPRWAIVVGAVSALALAGWLLVLLRTTGRSSSVLRITDDGMACWVTWTEGGVTHEGAPDCPDPSPAVGEPLKYLTTPWPVSGQAWDTELPWVLVSLLGLGVLIAGVRLLVSFVHARRRPAPERVTLVDPGADDPRKETGSPVGADATSGNWSGATTPDRPPVGAASTFSETLDLAERDLGWAEPPAGTPGPAGWWVDVVTAARSGPRWSLFLAVAAGVVALSASDDADVPVMTAGLVVAALGATWTVARSIQLLLHLRRPWQSTTTTPWAYRAIQDAEGSWSVLLLDGSHPRWLIPLRERPPVRGTCRVRGELRDGVAVHVLIGADVWLPSGDVVEVDADLVEGIRDDLTYQLTGQEPDPALP